MLLRAAVVAALFACLHPAPALAAPTVTIDSGPDGPTNESSPTFGFTVENATAVECSVDRGTEDFGPCTSPSSHTDGPLADGDWRFRVRATDDVPETTTETRDFSVDTVGPTAEVTGPRRTSDRKPSFQVSSPEAGVFFTCRLAGGKPAAGCGPSFAPDRRLKFGKYKLVVTAHDTLGNSGPPLAFRFKVLRPPLEQGRAKRTVATALRRHKFAKRVIDNLERSCTRRGRYTFSCRFSSAFPGYSLKGHGRVELRRGRISYRFVVRAQGERAVLTDENEGRFPG
jgi:Bacterial Ig-like domain